MNCKKTERSAKLDQVVLKKWTNGLLSTEAAKIEIEKNNRSSFRDIHEFVKWANSLGWNSKSKTIQNI